jgi:hypothetical protein
LKKYLSGFKYGRAVLISLVSSLLGFVCASNAYICYLNNQAFEEKNIEFIDLNNKINTTSKRITKLLRDNADYFKNLADAPSSKSDLVDLISKIGVANNIVIRKVVANDGAQDKLKNDLIELEIDGRYQSIVDFMSRVKPFLSASNIDLVRLEKKSGNHYIHGSLKIKFSPAPNFPSKYKFVNLGAPEVYAHREAGNKEVFQKDTLSKGLEDQALLSDTSRTHSNFAFRARGEDYFFGTPPGEWRFYSTGFVPQREPPAQQAENKADSRQPDQPISPDGTSVKRADPFLPGPPQQLQPGASQKLDSFSNYLSGVMYAKHMPICIVTIASGESIVLGEGEAINSRAKVKSIRADGVLIQNKQDKFYKVGQEIYAK